MSLLLELGAFLAAVFCVMFIIIVLVEGYEKKKPRNRYITMSSYEAKKNISSLLTSVEKSGTLKFHLQNGKISEEDYKKAKETINL